jgi:hypothetical protein
LIVQFAIARCSDQKVDDQGDLAPYDPPRQAIIRDAWSDPESKKDAGGDASTFASVKEAKISFGSRDPPPTASRQSSKTTASHNQTWQTRARDWSGDGYEAESIRQRRSGGRSAGSANKVDLIIHYEQ